MGSGDGLQGQGVVITGANQGIGAAMARAFAGQGANLYLYDLRTDGIAKVAEEAAALGSATGVEAHHGPLDVTDPTAVERAMAGAEEALGALDVLVNCAGVFHASPILDYKLEDWERVMAVNVTGTMLCCQAALRRMLPAKSGRIVNLSSIAGRRGSKFVTAYAASKHAVLGITRCLAMETAGEGITVNAICPGYINTDMYETLLRDMGAMMGISDPEKFRGIMLKGAPVSRMVEPEEIAQVAVYLASPQARSMTGQGLTLDGGVVMQ